MARNKPWMRDELILALDLYFGLPASKFDTEEPSVIGLSKLLRTLPPVDGEHRDENYRSPSSVTMKLANFSAIDPETTSGLSAHSKMDKEIWEEFTGDRKRLHTLASTIRQHLQSGDTQSLSPAYEEEEAEAQEGRLLTRTHRAKERNQKLVKKKKAAVMKAKGQLTCEACGFDFAATYGERGEGFIECHHLKPLHSLTPDSKTRLDDLAVLCANCHRMVHAKRPWLSLEELKTLVR